MVLTKPAPERPWINVRLLGRELGVSAERVRTLLVPLTRREESANFTWNVAGVDLDRLPAAPYLARRAPGLGDAAGTSEI